MRADLDKKVSLEGMEFLRPEAPEFESPGHEPTTPASELEGRNGYEAEFLDGWGIDLPLAAGDAAEDMLPLEDGGSGVELKYQNFSVVMSRSRRLPMLTAANIDGAQARRIPRIQTWSFDGRIPKEAQWGDALYAANILDRGHMVRREDPVWGSLEQARRANVDTFHFTNSCPQIAGVNQKTWLGLENYVLHHAKTDGMRVNVFTGPFFGDGDLEYRGALVPLAFWKVVAIVTDTGRPSATAYKVDQEEELSDLEFVYAGYATFQISVEQVMAATGIDFGALVEYDGFSEFEHANNRALVEKLESFEQIRV